MSLTSLANQTLTIQRLSETQDNWGSPKPTWTTVGTCRARVEPVSAQDAVVHDRPDLRITHRLYCPGVPGISSGDRLIFRGRHLYVQVIRDIDELGRLTTIDCEERNA